MIYLTNLDYKVNEQDLMQHLTDFAPKRARLLTDKETGKPKGTGFVELSDTEAAQKAMDNLNGKMFCGRPLVMRGTLTQQRTGSYN